MDNNLLLIILTIICGVSLLISIISIFLMLRRRTSAGGGVSDEDLDLISKNIYDASHETTKEILSDNNVQSRLIKESMESTNRANAESWRTLQSVINDNLKLMNDQQSSSAKRMEERITSLVTMETNSSEALVKRMSDFVDKVSYQLRDIRQDMAKSLDDVRRENERQLKELRESNEKRLNEMRETVDEKLTKTLNDRLEQSFNTISQRLEAVNQGLGEMKTLTEGVGNLNRMLNNAKTRGNWGEVALSSLLEQILSPEQYDTQFRLDSKRDAVDFVVRMPGRNSDDKLYLPIDAKFPLEDYERLTECADAGDKEGIELHTKRLIARIKQEAKSISEKYIIPPLTTNFAIMYLPIEGLFAEVVKRPGLCDELQNTYKIMICGPTTITALLNSLQLGFKTLAVQERSLEVWKALATFKKEFGKFAESIDKAQKKLDDASSSLTDATKRSRRIQNKLNSIENDTPEGLLEDTLGKEIDDNEG